MQIPIKSKAYIPSKKILGYLLSESHAVGKSKAKYFRSFGFDETNAREFENILLSIARNEEVVESIQTVHGTKYVIDGSMETPKGVIIQTRTIWIVETGDDRPRFVTAYPKE